MLGVRRWSGNRRWRVADREGEKHTVSSGLGIPLQIQKTKEREIECLPETREDHAGRSAAEERKSAGHEERKSAGR